LQLPAPDFEDEDRKLIRVDGEEKWEMSHIINQQMYQLHLSLKGGKGGWRGKIRGGWKGNRDEGEGWTGITVCGRKKCR